VPHY